MLGFRGSRLSFKSRKLSRLSVDVSLRGSRWFFRLLISRVWGMELSISGPSLRRFQGKGLIGVYEGSGFSGFRKGTEGANDFQVLLSS